MNSFMNARDAVSAPLAECYVTVGGNRYNFMQAIDLEAVIERTKAEVPILGQTGRGNKATGWRGKGSATFHYNTSIFRELMYRFKTHGEDVYFDIQVSNEDPTSAAGRQTVVLKGCNINSGILAKFDADAEFLSEDICYKSGPLISPEMMREFLFPYYKQLINNIKSRQIDKSRHLFVQIDTDGFANPVIDVYKEIGMDYMSPFEVASGCDVVETGRQYPDLRIRGGFDKRILAAGKEAIDRETDRIMPAMKKRGGYIPCCDHGVPEEVDFDDYMHYRKRMQDFRD